MGRHTPRRPRAPHTITAGRCGCHSDVSVVRRGRTEDNMPEKAVVTVRYGPYMNCSGMVQHTLSQLEGLRAVLALDGHSVLLEEIPDRNVVELVVNGETVFQCNIKELDFGGDGLLDPLCEDARQAVLRAY